MEHAVILSEFVVADVCPIILDYALEPMYELKEQHKFDCTFNHGNISSIINGKLYSYDTQTNHLISKNIEKSNEISFFGDILLYKEHIYVYNSGDICVYDANLKYKYTIINQTFKGGTFQIFNDKIYITEPSFRNILRVLSLHGYPLKFIDVKCKVKKIITTNENLYVLSDNETILEYSSDDVCTNKFTFNHQIIDFCIIDNEFHIFEYDWKVHVYKFPDTSAAEIYFISGQHGYINCRFSDNDNIYISTYEHCKDITRKYNIVKTYYTDRLKKLISRSV